MLIVRFDYHPDVQQIVFVDSDTGELQERRPEHRGDAEKFYRELAAGMVWLRVWMEASGQARWFERLREAGPAITRNDSLRHTFAFRLMMRRWTFGPWLN